MIKIILTKGAPASGKSFWARQEVSRDPDNVFRINNDDLRASFNLSNFSESNEKIITDTRLFLIEKAIKKGKSTIIIDNVNANKRHFEDACKIAQKSNVDCMVMEKLFYIDLDEALERDSKRTGSAKVGEEIVKKFWKQLGGKQFKLSNPKMETFYKKSSSDRFVQPMKQNTSLPKAVIFDLDGTMCNISHRNPYDASNCDKDAPNEYVVKLCDLFHEKGYKIFFFSGREDKHQEMTKLWLDTYFAKDYSLHMRESENFEDDVKLKERLFETYIRDKFYLEAWVDDRLRVCKFIHNAGLPLFRVGDPEANF